MTKTVAIIGGGVIGGGWLARFLLNGWNINLFDPDPEAERKVNEVLVNARHALPMLYDVALPAEGALNIFDTLQKAVQNADWIQESVPERLDIKHKVMAEIQTHCRADAIIGSSTSGFKPSELQEKSDNKGQIFVTHPFNPVYLLPLIELVPSPENAPADIERAKDLLTSVGVRMESLVRGLLLNLNTTADDVYRMHSQMEGVKLLGHNHLKSHMRRHTQHPIQAVVPE